MFRSACIVFFTGVLLIPGAVFAADVVDDAIKLKESGVSDSVIQAWAEQQNVSLSATDVVRLQQAHVGDKTILTLMKKAPQVVEAPNAQAQAQQPQELNRYQREVLGSAADLSPTYYSAYDDYFRSMYDNYCPLYPTFYPSVSDYWPGYSYGYDPYYYSSWPYYSAWPFFTFGFYFHGGYHNHFFANGFRHGRFGRSGGFGGGAYRNHWGMRNSRSGFSGGRTGYTSSLRSANRANMSGVQRASRLNTAQSPVIRPGSSQRSGFSSRSSRSPMTQSHNFAGRSPHYFSGARYHSGYSSRSIRSSPSFSGRSNFSSRSFGGGRSFGGYRGGGGFRGGGFHGGGGGHHR